MTTYEAVRLDQIATIVMGTSPKGDSYNEKGVGLPLLNGPTEFGPHHPSATLFTTDPKRTSEVGDLLFCVRGSTTGRMNWGDRAYAVGRGIAAIRGDGVEENYFIRACIEVNLPLILAGASGATFPNLSADQMRSIAIPNNPHRRLIGRILKTIDDLIDNNRRRIELLEEMAQAIYREWFVHFRFPGHENATFVDSPLGPIPEGWKATTLGDCSVNFDRLRKPLSRMERASRPGPFPYYGAAKLIDWVDDWIFEGEYLLFAEDGSVQTDDGYPVLQLIDCRFWPNNHTHILQGSAVSTRFLYLASQRQPISAFVTGAAQPKITQANLKRVPILRPDEKTLGTFAATTDPLLDEWRTLQQLNTPLAALRDRLLPKMVSGEIDVLNLDLDALVRAS